MNSKLLILGAMMAAVSCFFLQSPSNQFQSTFNSTFLSGNERLFKPIFIPNITKHSEYPHLTKTRAYETHRTKENEVALKKILQPQEISQESKITENYSEEAKVAGNPLKFSSRYSIMNEDLSEERKARPEKTEKLAVIENPRKTEGDSLEGNELEVTSSKNEDISSEKRKLFSDRLDDLDDSEEEKEGSYSSSDSDELKNAEESVEIAPTTDGPHPELSRPTSFRKYSDEDFENYETTSNAVEDIDNSKEKEKEEEDKRSIGDYYNSGSKNYHSIQTPLNEIKYRGPHSFKDDFEPEKVRTRLIGSIARRPSTHNWPQMKAELEKLNEISNTDESYEKTLDEEVKDEVKVKSKLQDLEAAVEKDEFKYDQNKKYSLIDERNSRKQQQNSLTAEENKDDRRPSFQGLKQYQVDEKELNHQPEVNAKEEDISKFKINEEIWSNRRPTKNIFKVTPKRRPPKKFNISNELVHSFQHDKFLGPIVFNHNLEQERVGTVTNRKSEKEQVRNIFLKDLLENEKADQENLTKQKFQKSIFGTENLDTQSFNHLEESDEMYSAILANIQSVFGLRVQSGRSDFGSQKGSVPKVNSDETKSLTWSLPLKREKVNQRKMEVMLT